MAKRYMTPEEIEASIATEHARELAACDELTDAYLRRSEPRWTGRSAESPPDRIFLLEAGRQTKTYRASIELARMGFGEQANTLNRALFESMLVVRWINVNGQEAAERFDRAYRFEAHLNAERIRNSGWVEEDEIPESPLSATEVTELSEEFGKYGERMWTGHTDIRNLLEDVEGQFDEDELTLMENYLRFAHQENNQLLHSTVAGLSQVFTPPPPGSGAFGVWTGPSDAFVGKALFTAHFIYSQTLQLLVERFGLDDPQDLDHQLTEASFVFKKLPDGEKKPGRNDPCFCGSGKKYKKCHGAD